MDLGPMVALTPSRTDPLPSGHSTPSDSDKEEEHVDVDTALADFSALRQVLSHKSHQSLASSNRDVEKAVVDEFDLLVYLTDNHTQRTAQNFENKELGVVWDDLSVSGVGGVRLFISTFPDAVKNAILLPLSMYQASRYVPTPRKLLHRFEGHAKPGEMVLVLGRPGSGCSTFLKVITNERGGYLGVDGEISYGGIDSATVHSSFRGEVVYNQEDDVHHETLTVGQTLKFALGLKTPGKLLEDQTKGQFREQVLELLLRMLGMTHTKNTLVGSAYVRGVSGGERKRVSILEQMASGSPAAVNSWDNSSRGLDASTALDYAKSLRVITDLHKSTNFVSLYQAGESIYECFDKVLVIDSGRQIYYGPIGKARDYFTSLGFVPNPRQTTADYLTGCTDPNERKIGTRADGKPVPTTAEELELAYFSSEIYAQEAAEAMTFKEMIAKDTARRQNFVDVVQEQRGKGVSDDSPYTVSFVRQVALLARRQLQITMQDRLGLGVSFLTSWSVAFIAGSVYLRLPATASGAFTRGGTVFIGVLFTGFQAFTELASQIVGKPIAHRQGRLAFYRPSALTLAATLADAPINMVKIFGFCLILYFMSGLYSSAGAFFTFYVLVLGGFFSLAALFRLLGTVCSSFDRVARISSFIITILILYSGYLVPVYGMPRFLFWIYYLNPLNYAFSAAMANEFARIDLVCDGAFITPRNIGSISKYPLALGANQVCTLAGALPGSNIVSGRDYIRAAFDYDSTHVWRNFGYLVIFFIGFNLMQAWAVENLATGANSPDIGVYQKEDEERIALNEKLEEQKPAARRGETGALGGNSVTDRKPLTWENLCYTVPVPGGTRQLLDNVFGYVAPGTLTALMGSSGAGKTTLLDVLARRKNVGVISGDLLVGGAKLGSDFQRATGYAEQQDTHEPTSTVREAFRFSAYLRQSPSVTTAEKNAYVEQVIALLELEEFADSIIGFPGFGLGIEARKRVTIGVELSAKPELLLFLDEPTSGLDGQSAFNIVRFLRKLADAGQSILVTVHQPNSLLFESFDRLLLLKKGGRTVYFGDIGKDSSVLRKYFASQGAECPANMNPAEYMLEAIGAGSRRMVGKMDWADRWLESNEFALVKSEITQLKAESLAKNTVVDKSLQSEYAVNILEQLRIVFFRTTLSFWRNPNYGFTRLFNHLSISLALGLTFLNLENSLAGLQYRVFVLFVCTFILAIVISQVEPQFITSRSIFFREQSSKMYSPVVFALCQLAAEAPYSLLCAVCFFLLFYFPAGFSTDPSRAGYQFLMIVALEFFAVTLGQAIGSISPSVYIAAMQNPFLLVLFSLFCGVTVPAPAMPEFWRVWMYPLDPVTRFIAGMVSTELHQLPIVCQPRELVTFIPPMGQTCQQWAGEFVTLAGGYIVNPLSTTACEYCQFAVGNEFYEPLLVSFDDRWRDLGILFAFCVSNAIITITATKYLNYSKR